MLAGLPPHGALAPRPYGSGTFFNWYGKLLVMIVPGVL